MTTLMGAMRLTFKTINYAAVNPNWFYINSSKIIRHKEAFEGKHHDLIFHSISRASGFSWTFLGQVAYIRWNYFPTDRKPICLEITSTAQVHSVLSFVTCQESDTHLRMPKLNLFSTPPEFTSPTKKGTVLVLCFCTEESVQIIYQHAV